MSELYGTSLTKTASSQARRVYGAIKYNFACAQLMYESLEQACEKHANGQDKVIAISAYALSVVDFLRRTHKILWKFADPKDEALQTFISDVGALKTFRDFFQHMDNEYKNDWGSNSVSAEATFGRIEFTDCRKSDRDSWSHFVLFPGVQVCDWEGDAKGSNIVLQDGQIQNITLHLRCLELNLTVFLQEFKPICDLAIRNIGGRCIGAIGVERNQIRENFNFKIDFTERSDCKA